MHYREWLNPPPRSAAALLLSILGAVASAQPTEREIAGLPTACLPIYAATTDSLQLYQAPDLGAERTRVDYEPGWQVPYRREDVLIRVHRAGLVSVLERAPLLGCDVPLQWGVDRLRVGEPLTLLHRGASGPGLVELRGTRCWIPIREESLHTVRRLRSEFWFRILYGDGSSPGWLLNDGSQTEVVDLGCPAD